MHAIPVLLTALVALLPPGGSSVAYRDGFPRPAPTDAVDGGAPSGVIAFYSERDGDAEIFVMNADGSGERQLTDNTADDTSPAWSPDGERIAFESDRDDPHPVKCFPECLVRLYVMNADGSGARRLFDLPSGETHASWSPDGERIAFTADRDGDGIPAIWVSDADGDHPRQLTSDAFHASAPDWSPDGSRIAFTSNRDGGRDIWIMHSDGSDQRRLVDSGLDDYFPDWSPDGTKIAFFALRPRESRQDIWVVNADGSGLAKLTDSAAIVDEDPAWSPDGQWIAFQSDRDRNFEIYVMRADGSGARNLTRSDAQDYWPDWRPRTR